MPNAVSLHIGLNHVNPDCYDGWDGALSGCINDARSMQGIAQQQGFNYTTLIDNQATCAAVTNKICEIARQCNAGDYFLLTYSGHGGQVVDNTGEEVDGQNETWVLWDRQFIDNEIYNLLSQFKAGVKIFVSSDSCHSGTVIRAFLRELKRTRGADKINYNIDFQRFIEKGTKSLPTDYFRNLSPEFSDSPKKRTMPEAVAMRNYQSNRDMYDSVRNLAGSKNSSKAGINASVIYISGCQDNQFSYDGNVNGAFTTQLLNVWNNGSFSGSYPSFFSQIRDMMNNPSQVPNYMTLGTIPADFENSKPYTLNSGSSSSSSSSNSSGASSTSGGQQNPSMTATTPASRQGSAPVFQVNKGVNPYYYVEFATEHDLFIYGSTARNENNWYATWGERLTSSTYTMSQAVWDKLKMASRIYYRIGSTSSPAGTWNDLKISFSEGDHANAPFIQIQDGSSNSGGSGNLGGGNNSNPGSGGTGSGSVTINGSVGSGGTNQSDDVRCIQQVLNEISDADGGSANNPLDVDGSIGSNTIGAIRKFQTKQEFSPTGLVKVNSSVFHMMLNKSGRAE